MTLSESDQLRRLSLWWDTLPPHLLNAERPPLAGDVDADVAIVGAGFTGLWTAYYLLENDPSLRVVLLEAEVAGFGASGRNGGWCSSYFPASMVKLERMSSRESAVAMHQAMGATVAEVGAVAEREGIECEWAYGGSLRLARTPLQVEHAKAEVDEWHHYGATDYHYLDRDHALNEVAATRVLGATLTDTVAAINPAKLVRGLAQVVESRGATIYEHSRVTSLKPGMVRTEHGRVRAQYVVRATEGYTPQLDGYERTMVPVYSLMLATEPLPDDFWSVVRLDRRQTFGDYRHLIIYGQRTADGRIAFGGRGAQYRMNSRITPEQERVSEIHRDIWARLTELIPEVGDFTVTHTWGGPLGVPRDWCASVGLDRSTGIGWSGGYVGDGVATTNLGGRTLADLIARRDTDITRLPWVNHRSRAWEPEPLRWVGIRAGNLAMAAADRREPRTGKDSVLATTFNRFLGH